MLIGYARISKADGSQSLELQRDALREAGRTDLESCDARERSEAPLYSRTSIVTRIRSG